MLQHLTNLVLSNINTVTFNTIAVFYKQPTAVMHFPRLWEKVAVATLSGQFLDSKAYYEHGANPTVAISCYNAIMSKIPHDSLMEQWVSNDEKLYATHIAPNVYTIVLSGLNLYLGLKVIETSTSSLIKNAIGAVILGQIADILNNAEYTTTIFCETADKFHTEARTTPPLIGDMAKWGQETYCDIKPPAYHTPDMCHVDDIG